MMILPTINLSVPLLLFFFFFFFPMEYEDLKLGPIINRVHTTIFFGFDLVYLQLIISFCFIYDLPIVTLF